MYNKSLSNPFIFIFLQFLICSTFLLRMDVSYSEILYYLAPFFCILTLSPIISRLNSFKVKNHRSFLNVVPYLALLISLSNSYVIFGQIMHWGANTLVSSLVDSKSVFLIQSNLTKTENYLLTMNYFSVGLICIWIMKFSHRNLFINTMIALMLVSQIITGSALGMRILFVNTILSIIISSLIFTPKIRKMIIPVIFLVVVLLFLILFSQESKTSQIRVDTTSRSNIIENLVTNYYDSSMLNGLTIIRNNQDKDIPYWTLRPVIDIPVISYITNARSIFESFFGKIPITNRADDFSYVRNLGLDPNINTLSSYGYAFLDFGYYGFLAILFPFIILVLSFYNIHTDKELFAPIYLSLAISSLDQSRTYDFYSLGTVYAVFLFSAIFLYNKLSIGERRAQGNH